jgi:hypothetical protein
MLMSNKMLDNINLQHNRIGEEGVQSLATALKVNNTLKSIDLSECRVSKIGAKFLADALRENTSLVDISLSNNKIDDKGAQSLADSFRKNRSLRTIQLCSNRITDIGATKLADELKNNCDCGVTTINLKGNQISASLLSRIKSICKAKESGNGKELSSRDVTDNAKRKLQIAGTTTSKDDQLVKMKKLHSNVIASLKEHIARLEMDNARLNDTLRRAKPTVETIDLTTNEAERATKRSRTESDVKSNLAIMYEQNQKLVQIKQENVATKMALESLRGEKNEVEADLKDVKEDLEDAH